MTKLVIALEAEDMIELQGILIDRDEKAALRFLEERIAAKLPTKGSAPCDSTRLNPFLLTPDRKDPSTR